MPTTNGASHQLEAELPEDEESRLGAAVRLLVVLDEAGVTAQQSAWWNHCEASPASMPQHEREKEGIRWPQRFQSRYAPRPWLLPTPVLPPSPV